MTSAFELLRQWRRVHVPIYALRSHAEQPRSEQSSGADFPTFVMVLLMSTAAPYFPLFAPKTE
jgi:hypothetical protein